MPPGTIIILLIPLAECFNDITVLEFNDASIKELEKWTTTHDDAYDWSHTFNTIADFEGKGEDWKKREENLKKSIKKIRKCDLTKENLTDPVTLPKVDCLYIGSTLGMMCKSRDEFSTSMKKISRWLKPGGHLILYVLLNGEFYTVGEHQFHYLTLDEEFLKKILKDMGYKIETMELIENKSKHEAVSYDHMAFITAVMQ
ncbi:nicotinamide N-methyltransferase-like [Bombina bombina]|nr:nicotinamide N-methyltransferase-like [Bombina bombina]